MAYSPGRSLRYSLAEMTPVVDELAALSVYRENARSGIAVYLLEDSTDTVVKKSGGSLDGESPATTLRC